MVPNELLTSESNISAASYSVSQRAGRVHHRRCVNFYMAAPVSGAETVTMQEPSEGIELTLAVKKRSEVLSTVATRLVCPHRFANRWTGAALGRGAHDITGPECRVDHGVRGWERRPLNPGVGGQAASAVEYAQSLGPRR